MTRHEMTRRLSTVTRLQFDTVARMYREGYGSHGIAIETTATRKQVNAIIEWCERYGRILPSVADLAP